MKTFYHDNLYRSYIPKYPCYNPDGQGRDTYINYNNGGLLPKSVYMGKTSDLIPQHSNFKSLGKKAASFKYYSDGSGRDSYVLHESGGLEKNHKSLHEYQLKDFLRPETHQIKNKNLSRSNIKSSIFKTRRENNAEMINRKIEKNIIMRLYDKEKPRFMSKNKDLGYLHYYDNILKSNLPKISTPAKTASKTFKVSSDKSEFFKCSVNKLNNFNDLSNADFSKTMNFFGKSRINLNNIK